MRPGLLAGTAKGWRPSLRALGGRLGEQWERDRRDTLFVMAAILCAALPVARHLPWWAVAGFALLFAWRLGLVISGRWLPRASVRWFAMVACAAAVWAQYHTLLGRDAGVALLFLFLGVKLMEMRARRDLHVVVILCFFVLLTTFFSSQSVLDAALSAVAVLMLVTTMLTMQFGTREVPIGRRLRMSTVLIAQALPVALVAFVLFPRAQGPLWGWSGQGGTAGTGLSESMSPGQISALGQSDEVAFRVRFDGPTPPADQLYWRGPTFGSFDGRTWRPLSRAARITDLPPIGAPVPGTILYTVTLEPDGWNWLFALDTPDAVDAAPGFPARLNDEMQLVSSAAVDERIRYRVQSDPERRTRATGAPAGLSRWLELPHGAAPRARALALRWSREEPDPWRRAQLALRMFHRENFRYTLRPPALAGDPVDEFLFDTRAGFCEHYASAFAVLMRAMSIPARVVTGYQGGEANPVDGNWVVRQADAHAWTEIWLEGRGWVRVDPTAAVAPERIERGSDAIRRETGDPLASFGRPLFEGIRLNVEALASRWNDWVLSYDRTRQFRLLASMGIGVRDWQDLAGLLAAAMVLAIGAVALLTLHPRRPRDPVERCYAEFCDRLAEAGIVREPHETASALLDRARAEFPQASSDDAARIVAAYNALRYGPGGAADPKVVRHLRELVHAFRP